MENKQKDKIIEEAEILQDLYDEGYVDFTGDEDDLTLHANMTGRGLIDIYKRGYEKALQSQKDKIKEEKNDN
jgi:hypothetical protein